MSDGRIVLTAYTLVNAIGRGCGEILDALLACRSGLHPCDLEFADLPMYVGRVPDIESQGMAPALHAFDSRNSRLAQVGLRTDGFSQAVAAAVERYGADRIAVVMGTSTSGMLEAELAYRRRDPATGALPPSFSYRHSQNIFSTGDFVRQFLGLRGPALVISTACSSSAKVFGAAQRMISLDVCDAAVVGGVDSLCGTTLYGFSSLELISPTPCRPADAARDGISIGEGAGFAMLERAEQAGEAARIALLSYAESCDAYHMSTPHPDGLGAQIAMKTCLTKAQLAPQDIDYINLHGTASKINDAMEDKAVASLFGTTTPCSSTKGWTGHTLGAAGITEALISCLCIENGLLPGSLNTTTVDPSFGSRVVLRNERSRVRRVLSNSFGFGGNNCTLVFGAV